MLEDEGAAMLGAALNSALLARQIELDRVRRRTQFISARKSCDYDASVLDLGHGDGEALFAAMNNELSRRPVIVVLPSDSTNDRIHWLDRGAADAVAKAMDVGELAARVGASIRSAGDPAAPRLLVHGPLTLDPQSRSATWRGDAVVVTSKEYALLELLVQGAWAVQSRDALHAALSDNEGRRASNAVDVHVHSLRGKFDSSLIRTVRGAGYRIGEVGSLPR